MWIITIQFKSIEIQYDYGKFLDLANNKYIELKKKYNNNITIKHWTI